MEAHGLVDAPAYKLLVMFKYMPMFVELKGDIVCWYDLEYTFGEAEVAIVLDRAVKNIADVGSYTCALESLEEIWRFMQIRFFGAVREASRDFTV